VNKVLHVHVSHLILSTVVLELNYYNLDTQNPEVTGFVSWDTTIQNLIVQSVL